MQIQNKDYLLPTKLELIFYAVMTLLVVFIANFNYLTAYLLQTGGVPNTGRGIIRLYVDGFLRFIDGLVFIPTSAVFIFWSLVGIVVYTILQSVYSMMVELRNDIEVTTHFRHPGRFFRLLFWEEIFLQFIAHLSLYGLIVLWAFLLGYVMIPIGAFFSSQFLLNMKLYNALSFLSSFVLLYIGILVFALLLKLFFKRKQLAI